MEGNFNHGKLNNEPVTSIPHCVLCAIKRVIFSREKLDSVFYFLDELHFVEMEDQYLEDQAMEDQEPVCPMHAVKQIYAWYRHSVHILSQVKQELSDSEYMRHVDGIQRSHAMYHRAIRDPHRLQDAVDVQGRFHHYLQPNDMNRMSKLDNPLEHHPLLQDHQREDKYLEAQAMTHLAMRNFALFHGLPHYNPSFISPLTVMFGHNWFLPETTFSAQDELFEKLQYVCIIYDDCGKFRGYKCKLCPIEIFEYAANVLYHFFAQHCDDILSK